MVVVINHLSGVTYVKEELSALIKSVPEIYRHQSSFKVTTAEWSKISMARKLLMDRMIAVVDLYNSFGFDNEEATGIDIKLPKCNDFLEFKKCIDELEFILYKCPFFRIDGEELKFKSVDVGSIWFGFLVTSVGSDIVSKIANNISIFVDKCMVIKSHKITVEQQKVMLDNMKIEQKEKENILKGINKIYQAQIENAIKELESETGISLEDGEQRGVVAQSFEKANALIDKGLQIYASIDSPKEVKVLFEPLENNYSLIEQGIKLLEKKNLKDKYVTEVMLNLYISK